MPTISLKRLLKEIKEEVWDDGSTTDRVVIVVFVLLGGTLVSIWIYMWFIFGELLKGM